MTRERLQPTMTWAEDRATQRCDPSADSGAETGVGIGLHRPVPSLALRDWHQSDKPSQQDAAILQAGCPLQLANHRPPRFQFTVNQDIHKSEYILPGPMVGQDGCSISTIPTE